MNETQIRAQIDVLVEQRNTALNAVVNMAGELAIARAKITELEEQAGSSKSSDNPDRTNING